MSVEIHSPFLGVPLRCTSFGRRNKGDFACLRGDKLKPLKKGSNFSSCKCAKKHEWIFHGNKLMHFCGKNVELLWKTLELRSGWMINSVKQPIIRSKTLVKSMTPVWEEGLFLFRCSVFCTVISGVCLLVWYGQSKAKVYIETNMLPSVCTLLSDHIQRELDFGKVRRISPLSITLESCSIGPHNEEFSCGEVPTVKLRIRPFASLRRGKIVIDAVLLNPTLLVAQKKNYTWLGIPYSEGIPQRHLSAEEGIDYRTRTRRIAREAAAMRWERERDDAARVSAEKGYIISECNCVLPEDDHMKDSTDLPTRLGARDPFLYMDEKLHWRDHRCMDAGAEYDLKHADLERSFGAKISTPGINSKRRLLERSASAARLYFLGQSLRKSGNSTEGSAGFDAQNLEISPMISRDEAAASVSGVTNSEGEAQYQDMVEYNVDNRKVEAFEDVLTDKAFLEVKNGSKADSISRGNLDSQSRNQMNVLLDPFLFPLARISKYTGSNDKFSSGEEVKNAQDDILDSQAGHTSRNPSVTELESSSSVKHLEDVSPVSPLSSLSSTLKTLREAWSCLLVNPLQRLKSEIGLKVEDISTELVDEIGEENTSGIDKMIPLVLDSVHFKDGTLMLLAYGDTEPRYFAVILISPPLSSLLLPLLLPEDYIFTGLFFASHVVDLPGCFLMRDALLQVSGCNCCSFYREMEVASGRVKFQNHYGRVHVQLSGNCKMWRSDSLSEDGGWLSTDVYVDIIEQKWHANLKVANLFVPLFERILDLPITWSKGRASGEVHICMSRGETFPNLHGQLDVTGLAFHIYDAPARFSDMSASLFFRAQRIFLHNARGWFGDVPLEASGDFGIDPEEGEYHLMCQVPSVEVNALMKTFKMKPLLFPLAGSVTAVFNCQGPLDAPVFVGSALVSRKLIHLSADTPQSAAYEAMMNNKEAGAVAAIDHVPFSYVSANFTFNTDNCVADLYGIRATLVDGGEIRGAGNAWICPEGEVDDTAMDVNFSGNLCFDKIMHRYIPGYLQTMPLKLGDLNGETKVSGSLLRPRFDIKWTAPRAEGSLSDARGDVIISHDHISVNSSSAAFELYTKVLTSYPDENWLDWRECDKVVAMPFSVEGVELDLRMRNFEFFNFVSSYAFDSLRPNLELPLMEGDENAKSISGDVSISGLKLNQLMLAPQLAGVLNITSKGIKLDAAGRPDESLAIELVGPLQSTSEENLAGKVLSFSLQKGHLKANACYRPLHSTTLEAELQLNFQKRRGHGELSVLRPKFSGVLGEALDVAARWSGDVSHLTWLGEPAGKEKGSLFQKVMTGHLGSMISSMGRWRMRLEVPKAEIAEMLPLARLLSRSSDPAVQSRSKDLFIQSLQSVGLCAESLQKLLEEIRGHCATSYEVVLDDYNLPGLAELKGRWRGSLDASGGGNGDTTAEFDFQGEEWEWGAYTTQRILAAGIYSNTDGLRLEKIFIQRDKATIHADGTLLGPKTNLHFAVLNFPVSLVPTLVQVIENSATEAVHSLRQLLAPIRGILHMEGDLKGNLAKPECDVQVRLLDGAIGGIELGRAEVVASLTPTSRFLFNAKFEPIVQNGHVHFQGSIPLTLVQNNNLEEESSERDRNEATWVRGWDTERTKASVDEANDRKGEVRIDADIKDGGMLLLTALSPYANWLHGNAEVMLQVRGTVEQPVLDGSAYFHRATVSSPVLRQPITNLGGTVIVNSNRLRIGSLEGRVDTQLQITGSIMQPNISGKIKISQGEVYLPHDKGSGAAPFNRDTTNEPRLPAGSYGRMVASKYVSRFLNLIPASSSSPFHQSPDERDEIGNDMLLVNSKPKLDIRLTDLRIALGPELRIVYPLILNFAISGELELNGPAHPKWIKPKGVLTFENGDVNLVATQVRLKREHLNIAKFEPDNGLDPMLDLALVGSEWQFRIQSRASKWQEKLVVTSTRSVEQDVLSTTEAARVFESQLAESILEGDGQLAFKKLATATLETLMPRIEGKGEFGQARWKLVYSPQIPSLLSVDHTVDPLKSLASNISFGTKVEVQLGKRVQADEGFRDGYAVDFDLSAHEPSEGAPAICAIQTSPIRVFYSFTGLALLDIYLEVFGHHRDRSNGVQVVHYGGQEAKNKEKELKEAFDLCDKDKNGKDLHDRATRGARELGEDCSIKDRGRMIGSFDAHGDGCINYEEFKKMMIWFLDICIICS
ncbi:hypothetical protein DH2020_046790 [Rehmannia glutinosa]|uniref:EF-hand domain-containing protein n=1 Tax=Rehmannia glutinosa TaxID=99300 RepID=A0ABR0UAK2_REHGL